MKWYAKSKRRPEGEPFILTDEEKKALDQLPEERKRFILTPMPEKVLKSVPVIEPPEEITKKRNKKSNG